MNKITICLTAVLLSASFTVSVQAKGNWQQEKGNVSATGKQLLHPDHYQVYSVNAAVLKQSLADVTTTPEQASNIELPMPNGDFKTFKIWETPLLAAELSARYPMIKTYTAVATDNHRMTAKIDYTTRGFHAMVFDGDNTYFIDPLTNGDDRYYMCYYKHDYTQPASEQVPCQVTDETESELQAGKLTLQTGTPPVVNKVSGTLRHTYRLALATTYEYSVAVDGSVPTKPGVLSAVVTTVNRVNGVYERELAVTLSLIGNTDTLFSLTASDSFDNGNTFTMLGQNQRFVDKYIGTANYDIGHVFGTGSGGVAFAGSVCGNNKARGVTGRNNPVGDPFDIDYVAHEMGHQFGAQHTFNAGTGSCGGGNAESDCAYEPGSGSTIMAYAGICGVANNLQNNSDAYFHYRSLDQITDFITNGNGATCAVTSVSGNTPAVTTPIAVTYNIPYLTPFELTAPVATDVNNDELTYCWEEYDLGDFETNFTLTTVGPIFRSFTPDTNRTRVFPKLEKILDNISEYLGEKVPVLTREMNFRLTLRDIYNGIGCVNFSDDEVTLNVIETPTQFVVIAPNEASAYWQTGSTVTVDWDEATTSSAPINCNNVNIYLSVDGGFTYPYTLASNVPNVGSADVTVPNVATDSARVKVKGAGNVFFDLSNENFSINTWPASVATVGNANNITLYPVPATDVLNIDCKQKDVDNIVVVNALGQQVWKAVANEKLQVHVSNWAKGIYHTRFINKEQRQVAAKQFVVQ